MLALPKITYSATNSCIPDFALKNINTIFFNFIWGGPDKIKRLMLINEIENGGLNMVDLQTYFESIEASWINRFLNRQDDSWAIFMNSYLNT